MNEFFTGVLEDPRTKEEKLKDWSADEVLAGDAPAEWRMKEPRSFPIWNQYSTSACVAFAKAKQISIEVWRQTGVWIDFSPSSIYQLRRNADRGMYIADANEIVNKRGVSLEALMESQNLTEEQIMAVKRTKVADLFASAIAEAVVSYLYLPVGIDRIAQAIEKGPAVSLLIYANADEYTDIPEAKNRYLTYDKADIRHEVVAVDYYLDQTLGKVLAIEDSWGPGHGQGGRRIFTEDFVNMRVVQADYFSVFSFDGETPKPKLNFTKDLKFGDQGEDVRKLQDMLKFEGKFPTDQDSTGYYWHITAKAVLAWQIEHKVDSLTELNRLGGHFFGPASRKTANQKFA
jgi:hypothetical protein